MTAPVAEPPRNPESELPPEAARAAAKAADARAAEAHAVAAHAKKIAKQARAAEAKALAEAAKLRDSADPTRKERADLSTKQAKERLLEAARQVDPMAGVRQMVREHPYKTVGIAAGAGTLLGSSGGLIGNVVGGSARIIAAGLTLARPAAIAVAKLAAHQFAVQQAAKAQQTAQGEGAAAGAAAGVAAASAADADAGIDPAAASAAARSAAAHSAGPDGPPT